MPQAILDQTLEQLKTLESSEFQQLSQALQKYLANGETSIKRVSFHQALVASGLVRQIKTPTFELKTRQSLIQSQGESISQTIIEERR